MCQTYKTSYGSVMKNVVCESQFNTIASAFPVRLAPGAPSRLSPALFRAAAFFTELLLFIPPERLAAACAFLFCLALGAKKCLWGFSSLGVVS